MKPRREALTVPDRKRYWCVELEERGEHHFRFPLFARVVMLGDVVTGMQRKGDSFSVREMMLHTGRMGAVIGACWHHRAFALETEWPADADEASTIAYGEAVCDELQEEDYNLLEIVDLFNSILPAINSRRDVSVMAKERADFSEAPKGATTSS